MRGCLLCEDDPSQGLKLLEVGLLDSDGGAEVSRGCTCDTKPRVYYRSTRIEISAVLLRHQVEGFAAVHAISLLFCGEKSLYEVKREYFHSPPSKKPSAVPDLLHKASRGQISEVFWCTSGYGCPEELESPFDLVVKQILQIYVC